jgi:hypothetical protein
VRQIAPDPVELQDLVAHLMYKPRWVFTLADTDRGQGSEGLTLQILITTPDSYHPEQMRSVMHYMPVPPAAYDRRSWRRWLLDQILLVERHEACEFFTLHYGGKFIQRDGATTDEYVERPYAPSHGPGNDPYIVREIGTDEDVRTSYRGEVKPRTWTGNSVC